MCGKRIEKTGRNVKRWRLLCEGKPTKCRSIVQRMTFVTFLTSNLFEFCSWSLNNCSYRSVSCYRYGSNMGRYFTWGHFFSALQIVVILKCVFIRFIWCLINYVFLSVFFYFNSFLYVYTERTISLIMPITDHFDHSLTVIDQ